MSQNIYYTPYEELCLPLPMSQKTRQVMYLFWCKLCTELLSWVNEPLMGYRLLHLNFVTGILPKWHKSVDVAVTALWRGTLQLRRGHNKTAHKDKVQCRLSP